MKYHFTLDQFKGKSVEEIVSILENVILMSVMVPEDLTDKEEIKGIAEKILKQNVNNVTYTCKKYTVFVK